MEPSQRSRPLVGVADSRHHDHRRDYGVCLGHKSALSGHKSPSPSEASHAATVTRHGLRQDAKSKQPISFVEMQQIVDNVERQAAGWRTLQMAMPDREDRSIKVSIDFLDDSRPDQTVEMVVDRRTGGLGKSNTFSSRSLGAKLRLFTRPIQPVAWVAWSGNCGRHYQPWLLLAGVDRDLHVDATPSRVSDLCEAFIAG